MKITFLAWRDLANELAGGSEMLIDKLAAGLGARGHDVSLACAAPTSPRAYRVIENGGRHTQYMRMPFTYLREFRDADLVVDVANGMAFYAAAWRRGPSICFVNHIHTDQWSQWFPEPVAFAGRSLERWGMPLAYRNRLFVAVSASTADALERIGVGPDRIRIVNNGVDIPETTRPKSREPLFLALGRLVPHKRFDILLRAWEHVRPLTGGRLVIAGEGPEQPKLDAMKGDGVELVGKVSEEEKQRLYGEAWLLLHPAMHEGWGLVVTEAAAAGTPTLGFWVPGVRDSVVHGQTGILVDTEDQLADEWLELARDAGLRASLGQAARLRAHDFTWSATVERFEQVAHEAILLHRRPSPSRQAPLTHLEGDAGFPANDRDPDRLPFDGPQLRLLPAATDGPALSIIIPAFDEAARLPTSLPLLLEQVRGTDTEVIVVDDGSADATIAVASRLLRPVPGAHVMALPRHRGKGAAVRAGVERARGNKIVFMDADMATDLAHLPSLVAGLDDAHVVVGSRAAPGAVVIGLSPARAAMEWGFNRLARAVTGVQLHDTQCGFKAFRASAAKVLFHLLHEDGLAFDVELLALADRIGYRTVELPVRWQAVRGSHVRIPSDMIAMSLSVGRIRTRTRRGQFTASIEASCRWGAQPGHEIAAGLRDHLDGSATVFPWNDGALVLLPFAAPGEPAAVANRLGARLPDVVLRPSVVKASSLLHPSAHELRTALRDA